MKKYLDILFYFLLIILCKLHDFGYLISLFLIIIYAVKSKGNSFSPLFGFFLIRTINPALSEGPVLYIVSTWFVFFLLMFIHYINNWKNIMVRSVLSTSLIIFVFSSLIFAFINSEYIYIAHIKIILFYFGCYFFVCAYPKLNSLQSLRIKGEFQNFGIFIVISSFIVLIFPNVGYFKDPNGGFQGVFNHPQALALVLSPITGFLFYRIFLNATFGFRDLVFFTCSLMLLFATKGRTGIIAMLLALILYVFFSVAKQNNNFNLGTKVVLKRIILTTVFLIAILCNKNLIREFIMKNTDESDVTVALTLSRVQLIDESLSNFLNNPFFGIGFGISKSDHRPLRKDSNEKFEFSAPTEKPYLFLAVLEEVGVIGFTLFILFFRKLMILLFNNSKSSEFAFAALVAVCTNISEMTFFSFGGVGLFIWAVISVGLLDTR